MLMNLTEGKRWSILVENHDTLRYLPNVPEWQIPDLFPPVLFVGLGDECRICDSTFN